MMIIHIFKINFDFLFLQYDAFSFIVYFNNIIFQIMSVYLLMNIFRPSINQLYSKIYK